MLWHVQSSCPVLLPPHTVPFLQAKWFSWRRSIFWCKREKQVSNPHYHVEKQKQNTTTNCLQITINNEHYYQKKKPNILETEPCWYNANGSQCTFCLFYRKAAQGTSQDMRVYCSSQKACWKQCLTLVLSQSILYLCLWLTVPSLVVPLCIQY